jgi:hypothetical protein
MASTLLLAAKQRDATLPLAENFVVSALATGGSVLAAAVRAITKVIDKVTCTGFSSVMTGMHLMAFTMSICWHSVTQICGVRSMMAATA